MYDNLCELISNSISNHACPKAVIDLGFTCGCPINPVHLVKNYHPRGSKSSSSKPSSIFESLLEITWDIWFGYESGIIGLLHFLSGSFEVKVLPSAYASLAANVGIFENISIPIHVPPVFIFFS